MSQHCVSSNQSLLGLSLQFPPIPLASGDVLVDDEARKHPVIRVTVSIYTECGDDPIEIDLEPDHGGWWTPDDLRLPTNAIHGT